MIGREPNVRNMLDLYYEARALETQKGSSPGASSQMKVEYDHGEYAEPRTLRRRNADVVATTRIAETSTPSETLTREDM